MNDSGVDVFDNRDNFAVVNQFAASVTNPIPESHFEAPEGYTKQK